MYYFIIKYYYNHLNYMTFHTNIENDTINNDNYRKTIFTDSIFQLVLMSLKPNENIPREVHKNGDQFIRIEEGKCKIITDNEIIELNKNGSIIIPRGTYHEVINNGDENLKLYTLYSPPQHSPNLIQKDKPIAGCEEISDEMCQRGGSSYKCEKYINKISKILI